MSERLENFIRNNKSKFDELEPPEGLWDKIEKSLDDRAKPVPLLKKKITGSVFLKIAAVLVVFITAGLGFWFYRLNSIGDVKSISPHLAKQQVRYISLIAEKRNELKQVKEIDPDLYQEFSTEIKNIDENYRKLRKELSSSPNQEETVKAMIRNLQIQIQVLNQQLQIIEQVSDFKNNSNNENQGI